MAGALRAEATLAVANGLYLVFLVLGGIVVPLDQLPAALESVARLLPAAALSELVRAGLEPSSGDLTGPFVVLSAWASAPSRLRRGPFAGNSARAASVQAQRQLRKRPGHIARGVESHLVAGRGFEPLTFGL